MPTMKRCRIKNKTHLLKLLKSSEKAWDANNLRVEVEVQLAFGGKATKSIRRFGENEWELYTHGEFVEFDSLEDLMKGSTIGEALKKGALIFTGEYE